MEMSRDADSVPSSSTQSQLVRKLWMRFDTVIMIFVVGFAGWNIPGQFRSAGLQQSSTPKEWALLGRLALGSVCAAPLVAFMTWGYWRYRKSQARPVETTSSDANPQADVVNGPVEGQFSLRFALSVTTLIAIALAILRFWQLHSKSSVIAVWATWMFVSFVCGVIAFRFDSNSPRNLAKEASGGTSRRRGWHRVLIFTSIAGVLAAVGFFFFEKPYAFLVCGWLILFVMSVWAWARPVFTKTLVLLWVVYLPFVWLIPYGFRHRDFGEAMELMSFLPLAPGIAPGIMLFRGGPDNLAGSAIGILMLSGLSCVMASRNRYAYAWYAAFACFLTLCCSFGLHAMFRA